MYGFTLWSQSDWMSLLRELWKLVNWILTNESRQEILLVKSQSPPYPNLVYSDPWSLVRWDPLYYSTTITLGTFLCHEFTTNTSIVKVELLTPLSSPLLNFCLDVFSKRPLWFPERDGWNYCDVEFLQEWSQTIGINWGVTLETVKIIVKTIVLYTL